MLARVGAEVAARPPWRAKEICSRFLNTAIRSRAVEGSATRSHRLRDSAYSAVAPSLERIPTDIDAFSVVVVGLQGSAKTELQRSRSRYSVAALTNPVAAVQT